MWSSADCPRGEPHKTNFEGVGPSSLVGMVTSTYKPNPLCDSRRLNGLPAGTLPRLPPLRAVDKLGARADKGGITSDSGVQSAPHWATGGTRADQCASASRLGSCPAPPRALLWALALFCAVRRELREREL
mmetsp:Transcript_35816/g.93534  ORF Transcript_35816/g.93534 Transcript_35816/m.93534 type:complete len:131 (+) Transcript_35816:86-478(+)